MRRLAPLFALTTLAAAGFTVAHAADDAAEPGRKQVRIVRMEHGAGGAHAGLHALGDLEEIEGDRLKIDDLDSLLPGETRSYYTDGGKEVIVTRGEGEAVTLEVDGKKVELGRTAEALALAHLDGEAAEGTRRIVVRHHAAEGGEGAGGEAIEKDVMVIARQALAEGTAEGGEPPVIIEIVGDSEGKQERRVVVLRVKGGGEGN